MRKWTSARYGPKTSRAHDFGAETARFDPPRGNQGAPRGGPRDPDLAEHPFGTQAKKQHEKKVDFEPPESWPRVPQRLPPCVHPGALKVRFSRGRGRKNRGFGRPPDRMAPTGIQRHDKHVRPPAGFSEGKRSNSSDLTRLARRARGGVFALRITRRGDLEACGFEARRPGE